MILLYTTYKINSSTDNIEEYLQELGVGKAFYNRTQITDVKGKRVINWTSLKLRNFQQKIPLNGKQVTEWLKIFPVYVYYKRCMSTIYKEHLHKLRRQTMPFKIQAKILA